MEKKSRVRGGKHAPKGVFVSLLVKIGWAKIEWGEDSVLHVYKLEGSNVLKSTRIYYRRSIINLIHFAFIGCCEKCIYELYAYSEALL